VTQEEYRGQFESSRRRSKSIGSHKEGNRVSGGEGVFGGGGKTNDRILLFIFFAINLTKEGK